MIHRRILRQFCTEFSGHAPAESLRMTLENPKLLEIFKKKDRTSQLLTKAKFGMLASSLASMAVFGPSGVSVFICGSALGMLSMDRSITHYYKQRAISQEVEHHKMNLDIQK